MDGAAFATDRRDVDLYLANRIVLPIVDPIRIYGELDLGHRWMSSTVHRGHELGSLSGVEDRFLVLVAVCLTARLSAALKVMQRLAAFGPCPRLHLLPYGQRLGSLSASCSRRTELGRCLSAAPWLTFEMF